MGRINRLRFFGWALLCFIVAFIGSFAGIVGVFIYIGALVPYICLVIARLHDTNNSALGVVLAFMPGFNIVLFFYCLLVPGTKGDNKFGPDPLAQKRFLREVRDKSETSRQWNDPNDTW